MAPTGGGATPVTFDMPLNADTKATFSTPNQPPVVTFDGAATLELDGQRTLLAIAANTDDATGVAFPLDITMGTTVSTSKPVAVKVMKHRPSVWRFTRW